MKTLRAVIYFIIFAVGVVILVLFLNQFINGQISQDAAKAPALEQPTNNATSETSATVTTGTPSETTEQSSATGTTAEKTTPVTQISTVGLVNQSNSYYDANGTVKAIDAVSLFPQATGAVKQINFQEGDTVKAGDTIMVLTGSGLSEHPTETQMKIALANLATAKTALGNLQKTNAATLQTASLQLQSAVSQANGIAYDLATIQQNQSGVESGLNILENSLQTTEQKNARDAYNARNDLDNLIYTLNAAQNDRAQTVQQIQDIQDQINNLPQEPVMVSGDPSEMPNPAQPAATPSEDPAAALNAQLVKLQTALQAQEKGISDLYTAIDKSKIGYSTLLSAAQLGVNQILSQIQSSQNQSKVFDISYDGTKTKLGYTGDSSDALKLAQQSYNTAKIQAQTSLDNAQNQVKIAQLNYDLASNTASGLTIKSPFSGIISSLDLSVGEQVNPQAAVAEVINPQAYQLEINIDPSIADRLDMNAQAQVTLGGRTLDVPIKSIAPTINATTHLVKVRLALPPITFKANQILSAQLPLTTARENTDNSGTTTSTTFLPLDAVIIGTESQFVYINESGKAKKVDVVLGQISGDQVEIVSGLAPNSQVILQGAKDLSEGQTVTVK